MAFSRWQHQLCHDIAVQELSTDAKWLFVWSCTRDSGASMTGLSVVTLGTLAEALGDAAGPADGDRVMGALEALGRKPLVKYDLTHGVLWAVNRLRYENTGSRAWLTGAHRHAMRMPQASAVLGEFWELYGEVFGAAALDALRERGRV